MSTLAYAGRTVDVLAFQADYTDRQKEQKLEMALVGPNDSGSIVTGIQKLMQRVCIVLLTKKGSLAYRPLDGALFLLEAERGVWRTTADVEQAFFGSRLDVSRQVREQETDSDPADERLAEINLLQVVLAGDRVSLRVEIVSLAGTSYNFIVPITTPIH